MITCNKSYARFDKKLTTVLDSHAPTKKKGFKEIKIRTQINFLRGEIMERQKLKNKANKTKT